MANLRDRMTAMNDIDEFIAAHSTAKLLRAHQRKALKNDLWLYVQDLHKVTEGLASRILVDKGIHYDPLRAEVVKILTEIVARKPPEGGAG